MTDQQYKVFQAAMVLSYQMERPEWQDELQYVREIRAITDAAAVYIESIPSPVNPPTEVRKAIVRKFLYSPGTAESVLQRLSYDGLNKCYGFMFAGMYHGVEPDGHIHT